MPGGVAMGRAGQDASGSGEGCHRDAVRGSAQAAARRVWAVPARRRPVTRGPAVAGGGAARPARGRVPVRGGTDEETGEALSAAALAERVAWCAALVRGMAAGLVTTHWEAGDLRVLSSGRTGWEG